MQGQSVLFGLVAQAMNLQTRQLELLELNELYRLKLAQGHRLSMAQYCHDLAADYLALCRDMATLTGDLERAAHADYLRAKGGTA